jgi:amino acid adenylation domain-containing protein
MTPKALERTGQSLTMENQLSLTQERLWVLDQLHPANPAQNVACGLRWAQRIDRGVLKTALGEVLQPHEILRTEFHSVNGAPVQVVLSTVPVTLNAEDLRGLPPHEREAQLLRRAREEARDPFDLTHAPLLRAALFQLSETEHVLLVVAHRIVCDEASIRILLSEIHSRYREGGHGKSLKEVEPPRQYHELEARKTVSAADLSYWKERLGGAPASIDLPTDRPRPALQTFRGARQRIWIEVPLLEQLRGLSQSRGVTFFSTLLAVFNILLLRYSRQDDMVVGMRVSGRGQPELEKLIGPLENILALRTDLSGEPSFTELLARVHEVTQGAFSRNVPFETLVKQMRLERDMSRHPLFQIVFTMQDAADGSGFPAGVSFFEVESPTEQFDLSVEVAAKEDKLEAIFSYNPDLFDASTIGRMTGHFQILLESAAQDPRIKVSCLPLLSEAERHQLLVEWNDTRVPYPTHLPLHKFIEDQAGNTPDSVAVIFDSERLTYQELNCRANQLAHRLQKIGVGPDILVAVCAERSLALVIALLAVLKAGGAYVPFDPENPKDRLETMLRDSDPPLVLTQVHLLDRVPNGARSVFCLDRDWPSVQTESRENLSAAATGKNLAYAIYTSGSTGKPKGVPNVHEGIVNRLLWMQDMYQLTGKDRVLQKTPFSFDVSVWEFFWPLMTGATLVVARPGGHRDPAYLVNLIAEHGITTLHFVPSMLSIFLESAGRERCRSVRQVFASGEALPFELQQRFFERLGSELHNLYGPTEAAVDVTYWPCRPDSRLSIVPIGRPIANTQIYILDGNLQPVPIGVAGELHIGGIGLARGYLNRPDLTAEKFIPDPFSETPGARLYKTGDLARFLADGNIEYLGRIDHQVKLRGFRIELGEVEAVLGECTGVLQAVVVVREDNAGDKRLVAYLIAAPGKRLEVENLRRETKNKLPEYMVPSRFVFLESFPMTTSGKVDRKALPAPPLERGSSTTVVVPRNELESEIASIFAQVLGLLSVGVTDNFFDLGGHSLLAGRLLSQINQTTGRQIALSALFRGATVESLAQLIERESDAGSDPVVMEIQRGARGRLPFFAIVPPGEESLGYAMLARHMGVEQTVYKIQGKAPVTGGLRPYSEQEMQALTDEYIAAMRTVQPHGPYCLGGLCDGTHIAEQIVLRLEAHGEEVGLFAIFDTWVLQHSQRRWLWKVHYYGERLRAMKDLNFAERIASYKRVAENKIQRLVGRKPARIDWQHTYWPEAFTPARFRAPVILFKRPKQPFYYINDRQMGWGARTASGVEIHEVDFQHLEILREPHVRVFGEKLSECVAGVGRRSAEPAVTPENQEALPLKSSGPQSRQDS